MNRKLLIQYPEGISAKDRIGTRFENVEFEADKAQELEGELCKLGRDLFDCNIVKSITCVADNKSHIIFINAITGDLDAMDITAKSPNYMKSYNERLAEYLYYLAIISIIGYDYYIKVNVIKED